MADGLAMVKGLGDCPSDVNGYAKRLPNEAPSRQTKYCSRARACVHLALCGSVSFASRCCFALHIRCVGYFFCCAAMLRCGCLLLACVRWSVAQDSKTITGFLRTPLQRQINIYPTRLTGRLRPGSGGNRGGPISEAEIVGGLAEIQRAYQRRGSKYHERADL